MESYNEEALMAQEDNCRKALKTVGKSLIMRLVVMLILLWVVVRTDLELWVLGLMALVLLINMTGALPLLREWKKQRKALREILDQYE